MAQWVKKIITLGGSVGEKFTCNAGDAGDKDSIPRSGRAAGGGHVNPLVFLLGEALGQRSLMGYSP